MVKLKIADIRCKACGCEMVLADARVLEEREGFSVVLRSAELDAANLRCGKCRRRLFGSPDRASTRVDFQDESLDRGTIVDVECGIVHRVHYADGAVLEVSDSRIRRVE